MTTPKQDSAMTDQISRAALIAHDAQIARLYNPARNEHPDPDRRVVTLAQRLADMVRNGELRAGPNRRQELVNDLIALGYDDRGQRWSNIEIIVDTFQLVVQINGKWRAEIAAPKAASKDELVALAGSVDDVQRKLAGATPKRVIVVPGRLVNFVL